MIRTCLFDMGNVLVHFSHDRMCNQLGALCGLTGGDMQSYFIDSGRHLEFERGNLTAEEFQEWFERQFDRKVTRQQLAAAVSEIFTLNQPILPVLAELKSRGCRLVLLSNTNQFHYEYVKANYPLLDLFDDLVLSFEVRAVKPEPAIFEAALQRIGCSPADCFYTDDIRHYVEAGRRHGLDAEEFTTVDSLKTHLNVRGMEITGTVKI